MGRKRPSPTVSNSATRLVRMSR